MQHENTYLLLLSAVLADDVVGVLDVASMAERALPWLRQGLILPVFLLPLDNLVAFFAEALVRKRGYLRCGRR